MSAFVPAAALAVAAYTITIPSVSIAIAFLLAAAAISGSALHHRSQTWQTLVFCALGIVLGTTAHGAVSAASQQDPPVPARGVLSIRGRTEGVPVVVDALSRVRVRLSAVETAHLAASSDIAVELTWSTGGGVPDPGSPVVARISGLTEGKNGRWYARASAISFDRAPLGGRVRAAAYRWISAGIDRGAGSGAPLLRALLLGAGDELDERTVDLFRRAGASHILALSGMHLAVLAALVVAAGVPLVGRRAALVAAAIIATAYAGLIGHRPSLARAAIMVDLALVLHFVERPLHLIELVAAAFVIQLAFRPAALGEISFQLSYLALLGIATISPVLMRELRPWVPQFLGLPLAAGLGAQMAGAPVLLRTFKVMYPAGVVAGVILGPLVVVFMTAGIAAVFLQIIPVPFVGVVTGRILSILASAVEHVVWWFARARALAGAALAGPATVLSVAAMAVGLGLQRRRILWTGRR